MTRPTWHRCLGPADRTTDALWNRLLDLHVEQKTVQDTLNWLLACRQLVETGEYEFIPWQDTQTS